MADSMRDTNAGDHPMLAIIDSRRRQAFAALCYLAAIDSFERSG